MSLTTSRRGSAGAPPTDSTVALVAPHHRGGTGRKRPTTFAGVTEDRPEPDVVWPRIRRTDSISAVASPASEYGQG